MSLRLGSQTGSLANHVWSGPQPIEPEVDMGCTILKWTDRAAATILEVRKTKQGKIKEIVIQEDTATRTDTNGMSESQTYDYTPNPQGTTHTARLLKGGWKIFEGKDEDSGRNSYSAGILIGYRRAYRDYSF